MCCENWATCIVRLGCACGETIIPLSMFPPHCK